MSRRMRQDYDVDVIVNTCRNDIKNKEVNPRDAWPIESQAHYILRGYEVPDEVKFVKATVVRHYTEFSRDYLESIIDEDYETINDLLNDEDYKNEDRFEVFITITGLEDVRDREAKRALEEDLKQAILNKITDWYQSEGD